VRFRFIAAEKATPAVTILCRCLCVTRSGFYAWRRRPESRHAQRDRCLRVLVRTSHEASRRRYGSPRVHEDLIEQQIPVSRKRVARLMREEGLQARARKRFKVTTMSDHDQPVAANLLARQFEAAAPNQRWVGDTTEFVIGGSGKSELGEHFDSHGDAKMELFDYIEVFYNQRRRHSTLGQISPAAFESRMATQAA